MAATLWVNYLLPPLFVPETLEFYPSVKDLPILVEWDVSLLLSLIWSKIVIATFLFRIECLDNFKQFEITVWSISKATLKRDIFKCLHLLWSCATTLRQLPSILFVTSIVACYFCSLLTAPVWSLWNFIFICQTSV
jgi:hypothetical protein